MHHVPQNRTRAGTEPSTLCVEVCVNEVERDPAMVVAAPGFAEFYEAELDQQVRRAFLMVGSNELANDIVHDAMVEVYRRWRHVDRPAAYLNRSVLNGCRDAGRRSATQRRLLGRLVDRGREDGIRDVLDDALAGLPFLQRGAVVLRFYGGLSINEIADALGCAPGSVGPALDRGLTKLRKVLE
jgi:RNA polymerase sigma factor (sigma-70 family)